ncbi:MAG: response regulator [Verrucomicrobiota bacterium]
MEDEDGDIFLMQRLFRRSGIQGSLFTVKDGQQAIDYLSGSRGFSDRRRFPLPAVVFLDLKLPFKHGFEVLKWIRSVPVLDGVLVVVLTSSDEQRDMQQAYRLGARSYLVKPPTDKMLVELFKSFESHWPLCERNLL